MKCPQRPWPFPAVLVMMAVFGVAAAALRVGVAAEVVLGLIAAVLGMGRP